MPDRAKLSGAVNGALNLIDDLLNKLLAKSPPELEPGINAVRAEIFENAAVLGPELVGRVLKALGDALLSGDFGPANHQDSDVV